MQVKLIFFGHLGDVFDRGLYIMVKRRLLIAAGAAVLFGCIVFGAIQLSRRDNTRHNSGDTVSTNQESEVIQLGESATLEGDLQLNIDNNKEQGLVNEEDNTVFSFSTISVTDDDYDYYSKLVNDMGYVFVADKKALKTECEELLTLKDGKKQIQYFITEKGMFDEAANKMDELKALSVDSYENIDKRDRYLFNYLGLDYQKYYSNGVALFMMKKIQDVENSTGAYSVYAIYYYSYTTKEQNALCEEVVDNAIMSFTGSDYDKILAAHEYLRSHVNYVEGNSYLLHTTYGALVNKEAVCEGYAKAYKTLLNAMDIPCEVVINEDHAWNEVYLDGNWYVVDVTNDDALDSLEYFLVGMDILDTDFNMANYLGYNEGKTTSVNEISEVSYKRAN